jgi:pyruvate formate lyase activating enzyme
VTEPISRRDFICRCALCSLGAMVAPAFKAVARVDSESWIRGLEMSALKEAGFWQPLPGGLTQCLICPNQCKRDEGQTTTCRTRVNRGGKLYSLTYGKPCVVFQDPLEKNPLYHVSPGSQAIGVGTAGCNLWCKYCQNWSFSQVGPWETRNLDLSPEGLVQRAKDRGLKWITFSYTEPVAYYEYALDVAKLARAEGIKVAVVTAGFINPKPLEKLMACSDAFSVTLKGGSNVFYEKVVGGSLATVWNSIVALAGSGKWIEVVTLIVPTVNDDDDGIRSIARSLARLNPSIPLHFLRFTPAYKLENLPPTPRETLERARNIALKEGLKFVYLANLPGHEAASTYCPNCKKTLVERVGFTVLKNSIRGGACPFCRNIIPGVDL